VFEVELGLLEELRPFGPFADDPSINFDDSVSPEIFRHQIRHHLGLELSTDLLSVLVEFQKLVCIVGSAGSKETQDRDGYWLERDFSWQNLDDRLMHDPICEAGCGRFVFAKPYPVQAGYWFATFGMTHCFFQISGSDISIVSNVPVFDPFPTLMDYALWAHRKFADEERDGRSDPTFNVKEPGCLFQMAYGWDDPQHNLRYSVEESPYDSWLDRMRSTAREWLAQTKFPPKWHPGVQVFDP
jgi:hypothetical protein